MSDFGVYLARVWFRAGLALVVVAVALAVVLSILGSWPEPPRRLHVHERKCDHG